MADDREAAKSIVVVGASAGGIDALKELVASLPADLPAAMCIVLHIPRWAESRLPSILERAGNIPAHHGVDGERLVPRQIFVAPPGHHMTVHGTHIHLGSGPKENGHRPAIDPLFRTAADAFGSSAVGVLLSGASEDGTAGLIALKAAGAVTIVQDPDDALYPTMPSSAIEHAGVDHVLPTSQIGHAIAKTVSNVVADQHSHRAAPNPEQTELPPGAVPGEPRPGQISEFTCPECGGSLWESSEPSKPQYQCRVGHSFSLEALSEAQSAALEAAMWSALRSLEESIALSERIAERSRARGNLRTAERYDRRSARLRDQARAIRGVVLGTEAQETDVTR